MVASTDSAISRRSFLKAGVATTAAGAVLPRISMGATARQEKPNILFLMADQHRGDCLGIDGNRAVKTPNLDHIANEGARFRCAYSSTPTCTPARAGLLTGMSPWGHGML
ncbi:MAG: sulfatase-like hydrolase/transferase, partial [Candidatus Hydrogenedentes bacterium]|nr:sulfatase-like hydrolase/transferase [Candidatus Hydrogenedentota bacterium]